MEIFFVKNPGLLTTVQDLGRWGFLDRGVPPSGALDTFSCRIANMLVGNGEDAAVLEITALGPTFEVLSDASIALTGAEMDLTINGDSAPRWCSHRVTKGDILRISASRRGFRSYLSVGGGFDVPLVMGSRSTFVRAGFGGLEGRALRKGDILAHAEPTLPYKKKVLPGVFFPTYDKEAILRIIPGPQHFCFRKAQNDFFETAYEITAQSDRMGCRLSGPSVPLDHGFPQSIVTEAVVPGNVQIPADGQPIVLLVEQTTGGYAKIATVISADLEKLVQAVPGSVVRFLKTDIAFAHRLYAENEARIGEIRKILC